MNNFKKIFLVSLTLLLFSYAVTAFAAIPTFSISVDPNNSNGVILNVNGDANASVLLDYYSSTASGPQVHFMGNTNSTGAFSTSFLLSDYNITQNSAVNVTVNSQLSANPFTWPYSTSVSSLLTFSQSSIVTNIGQSTTVTASNNGASAIYLSGNSNPQVANFSISGNQIIITGISAGQTNANLCLIKNTSSSNSNCSNIYVIVQNSTSQLSFSQNNTSIISGQNVQISISGGNGFYQVQNNSNSQIISTSLNGPTLTLYANGTTGSSTITICSTDMNACGIVFASIGTFSSSGTGLSFSTAYPTITTGQTQVISISGGYGNYFISSNSNTNVVQTYLSTSSVTLYGNTPGNSTVVVCSPSGNCGNITVTVAGSNGGTLALSQNNISIALGQVLSVSITGGTSPYSILQTNDGKAQYSLNGSTVTVTAISAGVSSASICSAGGACLSLSVTINSNSNAVSGVQPIFSQNNFSINTNQTTAVSLSGNGGYYISNNSNNNIVSASVSGNSVVLSGVAVGSTNITICQTGGQCNTLYINVSNSITSTASSIPITFDKTSVVLNVGGVSSINISGGSGTGYYISYSSNPNSIGTYITGNSLIITGKTSGTGTLSVCSSANVCGSIAATINQPTKVVSTASNYSFTKALKLGSSGTEVTRLQEKLKTEGVYSGPVTGYYGNLTVAAVKKYQKLNGLSQLGSVGPGTREALNR